MAIPIELDPPSESGRCGRCGGPTSSLARLVCNADNAFHHDERLGEVLDAPAA